MRKGWIAGIVASGLVAMLFTGCNDKQKPIHNHSSTEQIQVYVSLFPLEDFAKKIGGDRVQVTNMVPPGVESHEFELSANDMSRLSESDLFIYNGAGFESWVAKARRVIDEKRTVVVNSTEHVQLLKAKKDDPSEFDPHVWLDPTIAKQQALRIRDALIQIDATHKTDYEKNYETLETMLDQLDQEYKEMVGQAKRREFITSHSAFAYLAHRYGLKQISISGISPSDEPSAKELSNLLKVIQNHQVPYIFFETLVSGRVAEVVKKEVKAQALVLNPLEGLTKEEVAQRADYFSIMRKNKENLAIALEATQP